MLEVLENPNKTRVISRDETVETNQDQNEVVDFFNDQNSPGTFVFNETSDNVLSPPLKIAKQLREPYTQELFAIDQLCLDESLNESRLTLPDPWEDSSSSHDFFKSPLMKRKRLDEPSAETSFNFESCSDVMNIGEDGNDTISTEALFGKTVGSYAETSANESNFNFCVNSESSMFSNELSNSYFADQELTNMSTEQSLQQSIDYFESIIPERVRDGSIERSVMQGERIVVDTSFTVPCFVNPIKKEKDKFFKVPNLDEWEKIRDDWEELFKPAFDYHYPMNVKIGQSDYVINGSDDEESEDIPGSLKELEESFTNPNHSLVTSTPNRSLTEKQQDDFDFSETIAKLEDAINLKSQIGLTAVSSPINKIPSSEGFAEPPMLFHRAKTVDQPQAALQGNSLILSGVNSQSVSNTESSAAAGSQARRQESSQSQRNVTLASSSNDETRCSQACQSFVGPSTSSYNNNDNRRTDNLSDINPNDFSMPATDPFTAEHPSLADEKEFCGFSLEEQQNSSPIDEVLQELQSRRAADAIADLSLHKPE